MAKIYKQVQITGNRVMADGTLRLNIDILNSTSSDAASAFDFRTEELTMFLSPTDTFVENLTELLEDAESS